MFDLKARDKMLFNKTLHYFASWVFVSELAGSQRFEILMRNRAKNL